MNTTPSIPVPEASSHPLGESVPVATARVYNAAIYEAIALKAYFIALDRAERGQPADPLHDWLEAEREFHAEKPLTA